MKIIFFSINIKQLSSLENMLDTARDGHHFCERTIILENMNLFVNDGIVQKITNDEYVVYRTNEKNEPYKIERNFFAFEQLKKLTKSVIHER